MDNKRMIDISHHQGNIDFKKLKDENVEYIILRISYGTKFIDRKFYEYLEQCKNFDFKIGLYYYSLALNPEQIKKECDYIHNIIKNISFDLPLFIDIEENEFLSLDTKIQDEMLKTFKEYFESKNYFVGLYCNLNFYKNCWSKEVKESIYLWVAKYGTEPIGINYGIWQFTSDSVIDGISDNTVDENIYKNNIDTVVKRFSNFKMLEYKKNNVKNEILLVNFLFFMSIIL